MSGVNQELVESRQAKEAVRRVSANKEAYGLHDINLCLKPFYQVSIQVLEK